MTVPRFDFAFTARTHSRPIRIKFAICFLRVLYSKHRAPPTHTLISIFAPGAELGARHADSALYARRANRRVDRHDIDDGRTGAEMDSVLTGADWRSRGVVSLFYIYF
jgi:hypothetical protein